MKLLFISKPYVAHAYRQKFNILVEISGYQVLILCPRRWGTQAFEQGDLEDEDGRSVAVKSLDIAFQDRNHFHFYRKIRSEIASFAPDLVFVEEEDYSFVTFHCALIAKTLGVPCMFYAWQNIHKDYPPPFCWFQQFVYRNTVGALAGSSSAVKILQKNGFTGAAAVVPQIGTNLDSFLLTKDVFEQKKHFKELLGISSEKFVVYFAGRIVFEKGVQTILEAFAHIEPELRQNFFFLCVGSGPYAAALEKLSVALGIQQSLRFVGAVPHSEISRHAKAADLVCLASLTTKSWKEQGPVRVVTESMAAAAYPLVSDSGELPEVVEGCGAVFEEGNSRALATKLLELFSLRKDKPEHFLRLVEISKHKAVAEYSAAAVARKLHRFISDYASNSRGASGPRSKTN